MTYGGRLSFRSFKLAVSPPLSRVSECQTRLLHFPKMLKSASIVYRRASVVGASLMAWVSYTHIDNKTV